MNEWDIDLGKSHVQAGGAPEVAPHLERMQGPAAPPARLQKPAALAGAQRKSRECLFWLVLCA